MNKRGHLSHAVFLYTLPILLVYVPMGIFLRYGIASHYAPMSIANYIWFSLGGCVGGLLIYLGLISLYFKVIFENLSNLISGTILTNKAQDTLKSKYSFSSIVLVAPR